MKFDFLGYAFCRRTVKNSKDNSFFVSFTPAVSMTAMKSMRAETRSKGFRNQTDLSLNDIANIYNPILRGWINYYGRYTPSENQVLRHFNKTLVMWAMKKYKQFRGKKTKASIFLKVISEKSPHLFIHWRQSMGRFLPNGSKRSELRGSRTVLREAGGEVPPAYSPFKNGTYLF